MKNLAALVLLVLAPSIPRPSGACSPVPDDYGPHELDAAFATDTVAPTAVDATFSVYRGGGGGAGCGDSCGGGFNMIQLAVAAADDQTPEDRLGYRFTIVGGQPPPHLLFPTDDRRSDYGQLNWRFDSSYDGAFSFDVEIRAVDLNGNVGPATVVTLSD